MPYDGMVASVEGLWEGYSAKSRRGWRRRGELVWALREINFELAPGEMLGVIGGNGSGKSTLLYCLAGVFDATRGRVVTAGGVASLIDLRAGMNRELTGRENLLIAGVLGGLTRVQVRERTAEMADFAELDDEALNAPMRTYSAGMGLRLGFSVTVHTDFAVLAVDEVLAVGDEPFQRKCLDKVNERRAQGCGVVLVSHELDLVAEECDRVLVLDRGDQCFLGPAADGVDFYRSRSGQQEGGRSLSRRGVHGRRAGGRAMRRQRRGL